LRQAIESVNLDPLSNGQDIIEPNPANIGTISPLSSLPALTRGEVTVQDFAINGSGAAGSDGLVVAADNVSLDSLTITAFGGVGVSVTGNYLTATGNTIQGNGGTGILIAGSNAIVSGNVITNNGGDGIEVDGSDNQIGTGGGTAGPYQGTGGNVVSGNGEHGIYLNGSLASGNTVENNAVGTDNSGSYFQGNGFWGVFLDDAPNALIADNLISGNDQGGLGIRGVDSTGEVVQGNYIGTDITGTNRLGNGYSGIYFGDWGVNGDAPSQSTIGGTTPGSGNVISANGNFGVWITGAGVSGVVVEGNKIGTDVTGTYALGNSYHGVQIDSGAVDNTIGGTAAGAGNVVSGNGECGFSVDGVGTSGNLIEGNLVGTDVTGSQPLGNAFQGMYFGPGTTGNTIGGTTAGSGNVISANGNGGIWINGASDDVVEGNMIGTDATGTLALGNTYSGVYVDAGASGNTIGGTTAGSGNVISGNHNYGVVISGQGTNQNVSTGNKIGTDVSGWTYALGNSFDGVYVDAGASDNTIGGTTSGTGNVIAFNGGNGVTIGDNVTDASTGDAVLGNSIFANAQLGIDLGDNGVTSNDSAGHSGPNLFQDFPVLSSAFLANGSTTITGTLTASPNTTYRVEFFSSVVADASGYGQGQTFLTFATVTTGGSGTASFSVQTPTAVAAGLFISATATDPNGNTSEFSADIVNSPGASTSVTWTGGGGDNEWSDPANWSDDQVPGAGEDVSINLPGSFTIVYSSGAGDTTIHSLTGSDDLSIAGGSLVVSTSSSLSGQLSIAGGSLTLGSNSAISGDVSVTQDGKLNISGSDNTISGNVGLGTSGSGSGAISVSGSSNTITGNLLVQVGALTISGADAELTVSGPMTFPGPFYAGEQLSVQDGGTFTASGPVTLSDGSLSASSGGTLSLPGLTSITDASGLSFNADGPLPR